MSAALDYRDHAPAPASDEAERGVLGSCLLDNEIIPEILATGLVPSEFYNVKNGWIFDAITSLYREGKPVDIVLVCAALKAREVRPGVSQLDDVGYMEVARLEQFIFTTGAAPEWALQIRDAARLRAIADLGKQIALQALAAAPTGDAGTKLHRALRSALEAIDCGWQKPIPLTGAELPPFPVEALPHWMASTVRGVSASIEVPEDAAAMCALGALAIPLQRKVAVRVENYYEPLSLFQVIIMESSARKSPVFRAMTAPIWDADISSHRSWKASSAARETQLDILAKQFKKAKDAAAQHAPGKAEEAEELARQIEEASRKPAELIAQDVTPESLAGLLIENESRMGVLDDEGGFFQALGRYAKGGQPAGVSLQNVLKMWSASNVKISRASGTNMLVRPALSVMLMAQEGCLRYPVMLEGREQGLPGRCLFSLPQPVPQLCAHIPMPDPTTYHDNLNALLDLPWRNPDKKEEAHILRFSAKAFDLFVKFERSLKPGGFVREDLQPLREWAGKAHGQVARIIGLLHCAEYAGLGMPWDRDIQPHIVERAIAIGDYLIAHAREAYSRMLGKAGRTPGMKLLEWIISARTDFFSASEARRQTSHKWESETEFWRATEELVAHNYLRRHDPEIKPGKKGGRPPLPDFSVNPYVMKGDC